MVLRAGRNYVPHIYRDEYENKVICTAPPEQVKTQDAGNLLSKIFTRPRALTAVTVAGWTASWATHFMIGLTDNGVWNKFCKEPKSLQNN